MLMIRRIRMQCHKNCNKNGLCNTEGRCDCFEGWKGADCSFRTCPQGRAWSDIASGEDEAHGYAECSNRGNCNTRSGMCECDTLFEGNACERMKCPNDCSEKGMCLSLAEAAATFDGYTLNRSMHRYQEYSLGVSYGVWDAKSIYGCVCDPGYIGHDCGRITCGRQDDRRTVGGRDETVHLYCRCTNPCNGTLTLSFYGEETTSFQPSDTVSTVINKLEALRYIATSVSSRVLYPISVAFDDSDGAVCTEAGALHSFTFQRDAGDLPPFWVQTDLDSTSYEAYFVTNQTLNCSCTECKGTWSLEYDGRSTEYMSHLATAVDVESALLALDNLAPGDIRAVSHASNSGICRGESITLSFTMPSGNQPPVIVVSSFVDSYDLPVIDAITVTTDDGTKESAYCSNAGYCDETGSDFSTTRNGTCYCDENYEYDPDVGECGRPRYNTSAWPGLQRCEGYITTDSGMDAVTVVNTRYLYVADRVNLTRSSSIADVNSSREIRDFAGIYKNTISIDTDFRKQVHLVNMTNRSAFGIGLDLSYRRVYFVDQSIRGISSYALDNKTEGVRTIIAGVSETIQDLTLNLLFEARRCYVTDPGSILGDSSVEDGEIWTFGLDQSPPIITNLTTKIRNQNINLTDPQGIALDLQYRTMYWTDLGDTDLVDGKVYRCSLDGDDCILVLDRILADPHGIVLDLRNYTMFITDSGLGAIVKSQMNYELDVATSNAPFFRNRTWLQTIVTQVTVGTSTVPLIDPRGIVIDTIEDHIYWTDRGLGAIFQADVNGTDGSITPYAYSYHSDPIGLALDNGLGPEEGLKAYPCYGHGYCGGVEEHFRCICDEGWFGNCNMSFCPTGPAWFDQPSSTNKAHAPATCSNAGHCDISTGTCQCRDGFEGAACERLACPSSTISESGISIPCSGHGQCLTMRQAALLARDEMNDISPVVYGSFYNSLNSSMAWDADHIQHCICYSEGFYNGTMQNISAWTGYDCSRRACPTGDPPNFATDANGTRRQFETQSIECSATSGTFTLTFRQATTDAISYNANAQTLTTRLQALSTIGTVQVVPSNASGPISSWTVCNTTAAMANITFTSELGDLPLLSADTSQLRHEVTADPGILVLETTKGTKLDLVCSDHGYCDEATGECQCFDNYHTSDADGNFGVRGDCGYAGALELWTTNIVVAEDV